MEGVEGKAEGETETETGDRDRERERERERAGRRWDEERRREAIVLLAGRRKSLLSYSVPVVEEVQRIALIYLPRHR